MVVTTIYRFISYVKWGRVLTPVGRRCPCRLCRRLHIVPAVRTWLQSILLIAAFSAAPGLLRAHIGAAIAVDREGRVYFVDTARNVVWRIEADGRLSVVARDVHTNRIAVGPGGSVSYPSDIWFVAVGPDRSLYRTAGSKILRLLPNQTVVTFAEDSLFGYETPSRTARNRLLDLGVDSAGNVYVADYGHREVRRVSPDGAITTVVRVPWPWRPTGIAVWRDHVYVLERWGNYYSGPVQILTISGFVVGLLGHPRVRVINPDGNTEIVVAVASTWSRLVAVLLVLLLAGGVVLLVRRLRLDRRLRLPSSA